MNLQCAGGIGTNGFYPMPSPWYANGRGPMGRRPAPGDAPPPPPAPSSGSATDLEAASVTRTNSAELQITTDEGDVVTITRSSTFEAMVGSLRYQDRGPEGAYRQRMRFEETSRSRELSISVEGDLSPEELKDIHKLMAWLRPAFRSASPRAGTAAALRVDGSKLDSLSGFSLDLQQSITRTWLEASATGPGSSDPAPADPPASEPAAPRTPGAPETPTLA
jgi:hypothetical protein